MPVTISLLFLLLSSTTIVQSRSLINPEQLMPLLLSSINSESQIPRPDSNDHQHWFHVIEHIIKYVSQVKSSEKFIDNLVQLQSNPSDKLRVLFFLSRCFRITQILIQRDFTRWSKSSEPSLSSKISAQELNQAQEKIEDLLRNIDKRITVLRGWIPPTIPFLGF